MQVGKEAHLNHAVGVLLHPDPQERAHVADEPGGTWETEKQDDVDDDERGEEEPRRLPWIVGGDIVHPGVGPTCPAALHELEYDINAHCRSQSSPTAAISQFIH